MNACGACGLFHGERDQDCDLWPGHEAVGAVLAQVEHFHAGEWIGILVAALDVALIANCTGRRWGAAIDAFVSALVAIGNDEETIARAHLGDALDEVGIDPLMPEPGAE